jgi:hypothetical protein
LQLIPARTDIFLASQSDVLTTHDRILACDAYVGSSGFVANLLQGCARIRLKQSPKFIVISKFVQKTLLYFRFKTITHDVPLIGPNGT